MWRLLKKRSFILIVAFTIGVSLKSFAQITPSVFPESGLYNNTISFGPSYGVMLDRNAQFWGLSLGYAYKFKGPWAISPSVAYDQEFDFSKSETQIVNTFTFIGTITYYLNPKWSLTTGIAKGFLDDDHVPKSLKWVNGDWATGITVGYSLPDFPFWSRDSFAISSSLEYNFNKNEFSFSLDLVIGVSW